MKRLIVIAPDKFKGTLTAAEAAEAIAGGLRAAVADCELRVLPLADGGEGTAATLAPALGLRRESAQAVDALGSPIETEYFVDDDARMIYCDCATTLSLNLLERPDVMRASSRGVGLTMRRALERHPGYGVTVGVGGTACSDAGRGMLEALGAVFAGSTADFSGMTVPSVCVALVDVDALAADSLEFAPQKGADTPEKIDALRRRLASMMAALPGDDCPGEGAGGAIGMALRRALGATLTPGADYVVEALGLFSPRPDLVVTGEGRMDATSAMGKLPVRMARMARERGIPTVAVAGCVAPGAPVAEFDTVIDCSASALPSVKLTPSEARRRIAAALTAIL